MIPTSAVVSNDSNRGCCTMFVSRTGQPVPFQLVAADHQQMSCQELSPPPRLIILAHRIHTSVLLLHRHGSCPPLPIPSGSGNPAPFVLTPPIPQWGPSVAGGWGAPPRPPARCNSNIVVCMRWNGTCLLRTARSARGSVGQLVEIASESMTPKSPFAVPQFQCLIPRPAPAEVRGAAVERSLRVRQRSSAAPA